MKNKHLDRLWEFPNLVVCNFCTEALLCALLRSFANLCLRSCLAMPAECPGVRAGKCPKECFLSAFGHLARSAQKHSKSTLWGTFPAWVSRHSCKWRPGSQLLSPLGNGSGIPFREYCFGRENSLSFWANSVSSVKNPVSSLLHATSRPRGTH